MSTTLTAIDDFQQVTTKTFTFISIQAQNLILNQSVDLQVMFYDVNKNIGDLKMLTLSGDDYKNWGNDDTYILNYVCTKFGLTLAPTFITPPNPTILIPPEPFITP